MQEMKPVTVRFYGDDFEGDGGVCSCVSWHNSELHDHLRRLFRVSSVERLAKVDVTPAGLRGYFTPA